MTAAGLELVSVRKRFGDFPAVADISLRLEEGKLLVLVGPSGSGKSTLLRMIAGLLPHDAGDILVGGRSVTGVPPARRDVAMVFQSYALFPHMTAAENLAFGLAARGVPRPERERQVAEVAGSLGLAAKLARYPRELSGGERQRVALGRAILRRPRLYLMDEPLSNLDAQLRVQTRAEILRLHEKDPTTTVYVTHDQIEALSLGERIGVMNEGRLEQIGTASDVYDRPQTLFVARFLGSPPMNVLNVTAEPPDHVLWDGARLPVAGCADQTPGAALRLGVRPQDVQLESSRWAAGPVPPGALDAEVELVEPAGDQVFLQLRVRGNSIVARAEPGFAAASRDHLKVWFPPSSAHLFDERGARLPA